MSDLKRIVLTPQHKYYVQYRKRFLFWTYWRDAHVFGNDGSDNYAGHFRPEFDTIEKAEYFMKNEYYPENW